MQIKDLNGSLEAESFDSDQDVRISSPFQARLHNELLLVGEVNLHPLESRRQGAESERLEINRVDLVLGNLLLDDGLGDVPGGLADGLVEVRPHVLEEFVNPVNLKGRRRENQSFRESKKESK